MVTIKSFTDLEQSKKLAEFLPIESADFQNNTIESNADADVDNVSYVISPCWSLAALLEVIGNIFKYNLDYNGISFILTVGDFKVSNITAVDASFEMIVKLKEESLL